MAELGSGNGSDYPSTLDTDSSQETTSTSARADVPNDLAAAVVAIQGELGTDPAGVLTDVKTLLQKEHTTSGAHAFAVTTKSANYSASAATDTVILVSAAATITLPDATTSTNKYMVVINTGTGTVTVDSAAGNIAAQADWILPFKHSSISVISDGTNWQMVTWGGGGIY
jgi:hypothetical protein